MKLQLTSTKCKEVKGNTQDGDHSDHRTVPKDILEIEDDSQGDHGDAHDAHGEHDVLDSGQLLDEDECN